MTKVTILGQAEAAEPEKKKIEFVRYLTDTSHVFFIPDEFDNIQLIAKQYIDGLDFMVAWDDSCSSTRGCYLGHFNDGVV